MPKTIKQIFKLKERNGIETVFFFVIHKIISRIRESKN